jgi:hypothetical protein
MKTCSRQTSPWEYCAPARQEGKKDSWVKRRVFWHKLQL